MSALRVGTRGSALALAQTTALAARFAGEVEIVEITTRGDVDRAPLAQIGGTGIFTSALREALLANEVDVIVHSMKDLPTAPHPGIALAAVAKREDARDALCARDGLGFDELPEGAKVGTGSPRRAAQLRRVRPDLDVVDIRGNVETRLARAQGPDADLDAVVLALAGLTRLGRQDAATEVLSLGRFPTAPAQGALAVETREGDAAALRAVVKADHALTRASADAERLVLAGLEAGCSAPIAASAQVDDGMLFLTATVYALDGSRHLTASHAHTLDGQSAKELGEAAMDVAGRAVRELVDAGAMELDRT